MHRVAPAWIAIAWIGCTGAPPTAAPPPSNGSTPSAPTCDRPTSLCAEPRDEAAVRDRAAIELGCPRDRVAIVATLDRRYANSVALRYVVDGCGWRALCVEDCTATPCRYLLASRTQLASQ